MAYHSYHSMQSIGSNKSSNTQESGPQLTTLFTYASHDHYLRLKKGLDDFRLAYTVYVSQLLFPLFFYSIQGGGTRVMHIEISPIRLLHSFLVVSRSFHTR